MKSTQQDRLLEILPRLGLSPDKTRTAFNYVFSPTSRGRKEVGNELSWDTLVNDITKAINGIATNRSKWKPAYRAVYEEYLALLRATKVSIESTRAVLMVKDPSAANPDTAPRLPATVHDTQRIAVARNKKLGVDGPTCGVMWQAWIDPQTRAALTLRFEQVHQLELGGKGTPPRPFLGSNIDRATDISIKRLTSLFASLRHDLADASAEPPMSRTLYGALHLAAVRMAEREVERWQKDYAQNKTLVFTSPLPVNWMTLLSPEMRQRVKAAQSNAHDVSPEGLDSFYDPDTSPAPILDPEPEPEPMEDTSAPASDAPNWD